MTSSLVSFLQRFNGWRLWVLFSLLTVLAAELMVSAMDLLLMGRVTADYLITGLVTAGLVAPASLFLLNRLLVELGRQQQADLAGSLARTEARLRVALDSTDEGILMVSLEGAVLSSNKRFRELWHVTEDFAEAGDDALLAHVLDQLVDPEGFMAGVRELYGSDAEASDSLLFKDGRVFSRYTRALAQGDMKARIWCFRDVSAQVRAQNALIEREEIFRAIVSQAGDGIDLIDVATLCFVEVNDAACRMLGYRREELIGQPLLTIQVDFDEASLAAAIAELVRAGQREFDARHRCKDGRVLDVRLSASVVQLHERDYVVGVWRDMTASKAAEASLREREEIFSAIVNRAVEGMLLVDPETLAITEFNDAACEGLGYTRDEFARLQVSDIQAGLDVAETLARTRGSAATPGGMRFESRHRCKDGSLRDRIISNRPVQVRGRTFLAVVWHDVTERKRAERELVESHKLLQTVVDTAPMRVFWKSSDLKYLGCNPAFARDAGKSDPRDVIGRDDFELGWADMADLYRADDRAVMTSGLAKLFYEEPQITPDGRTVWLSTSKVPLRNSDNEIVGILGIYEDVTERKSLEDALRLREQYQRTVLDNFPFMVWLKDSQSRFLAVNQRFAEGFGQPSAQSLVGKTDFDIAPRELAERYREDDFSVLASGQPKNVEEPIEIDGKLVWFETYKSPVRIAGQVIGTVGFARDITERKRIDIELARHREHLEELVQQRTSELLATEARASRILESAADGLYGVDTDGRVSFINPAACTLLGYNPDQVLGRSAHAMFHHSRPDGSPYPESECPGHQLWKSGQAGRFDDITYWHADGHAVEVALSTHPLSDGDKVVGAVVSIVDVGEQRSAARAREQALVAAENLARARSEFLANMSHEIRTPMNGVLGFAQIGYRNHDDGDMARDAFAKIIASGNQLLGVVNEILDFSKIDAGQLRIEGIDMSLDETLTYAMETVAERAATRGLRLRLEKSPDLPLACIGDPLRIGQVLLNLLSNAVKFTEVGSVTLAASLQGGQLVFRVIDTGIGMTREQLGNVFDPFQQADGSTTRKFGGTGLGLAICKRLVELMKGEIGVESQPGVGSSFEVRLPHVASTRTPAAALMPDPLAPAATRRLDGISILVAEDDPVSLAVLEFNLAEYGAGLTLVGNGRQAVERVIADGPAAFDIVLMDIQMPEMDGYAAARRILQMSADLPIVGQTAHAYGEERDKCFAAGMAGHIAKPIDFAQLVDLVLKLVPPSRRRRTLPPAGR